MSPVETSWNELRRALCVTLPKWLFERLDAQRAVWMQSLLSFAASASGAAAASSAPAATLLRFSADAVRALPVWASVADEVACLEAAGRYLRLVAALKHALALRPDEELRALLALLTFRPPRGRPPPAARRTRGRPLTVLCHPASTCARALATRAHALFEFFCVAFASALCTSNMFMCAQ